MTTFSSPYETCPVIAGENLTLRLVEQGDADDLLACYSDPAAQALFNADNCTDRFVYTTPAEMRQAIQFWLDEYRRKYYVRFAILEQASARAIGTIEMFTRPTEDSATTLGVLRVDLRASHETETVVTGLIRMIEDHFPHYFAYNAIATKIVPPARARARAFQKAGFTPLHDPHLVRFEDYYIKYY